MSAETTSPLALPPTLAAEAVRLPRRLAFAAGALTVLFCAALVAPAAITGSATQAEILRSAVFTLPLASVLLCLAAALATLLLTRARFQASVLPDTEAVVGRAARVPQVAGWIADLDTTQAARAAAEILQAGPGRVSN